MDGTHIHNNYDNTEHHEKFYTKKMILQNSPQQALRTQLFEDRFSSVYGPSPSHKPVMETNLISNSNVQNATQHWGPFPKDKSKGNQLNIHNKTSSLTWGYHENKKIERSEMQPTSGWEVSIENQRNNSGINNNQKWNSNEGKVTKQLKTNMCHVNKKPYMLILLVLKTRMKLIWIKVIYPLHGVLMENKLFKGVKHILFQDWIHILRRKVRIQV